MKIIRTTKLTGIIICIMISIVAAVHAEDMSTCRPSWYCTAYSQGECGSRECIDLNGCNLYVPLSNIDCGTKEKYTAPEGFFQVDKQLMKMVVEKDQVVQSRIIINSSSIEKYDLGITYPSAYTKGTEFVTSSIAHKEMSSGDFGIVVDSREIIPGTYIIPINISNGKYSRNITLVIDVLDKDATPAEITFDSYVKILGEKNILNVDVHAKRDTDNITYDIFDAKGISIYSKEEKYDKNSRDIKINLPETAGEGIYTFAAKIYSGQKVYIESRTFAVFDPGKYSRTEENRQKAQGKVIGWVIAGIILLAICLTLIFKKYDYGTTSKMMIIGRKKMFRINMPKFGWLGKKEVKVDAKEDRLETLKKSYDRGFISEREYNDAVRNYKQNPVSAIGNSLIKPKENPMPPKPIETKSVKTEKSEITIEEKKEQETSHKAIEEKKPISMGIVKKVESVVEQQKTEHQELVHEHVNITPSNELPDKVSEEIPYKEEKKSIGFYKVTVKEEPLKIIEQAKHIEQEQTVKEPQIIHKESILDKRDVERAFGLSNGYRLCSLRELMEFLPNMPEYMWNHHTKEGRNDFSSWIIGVFDNKELAEEFRSAQTQQEAVKVLEKYK